MTREFGLEYPERPLMSTLSDLLCIPHFTTSRGSTVRTDFLQAVAGAVGVDPDGKAKDELIRTIWETVNRRTMPADRLSPGGTVTNTVLQEIVDGILANGIGSTKVAPAAPSADFQFFDGATVEFDPSHLADDRTKSLVLAAQREGQNTFRTAVLSAYGGRCALSGTAVPAALDAAHIAPYRGPRFNVVPNGLTLRRDLHSLFDRGMIAIHEENHRVEVSPSLIGTDYEALGGESLRMPRSRADRPSPLALRAHRLWAKLGEES